MKEKSLSEIAEIIIRDWRTPYFGAAPYLQAMRTMNSIDEDYGLDSGRSVVTYFLANAQTWRGETAREVKKELKRRLA